jgi:hypothetical protein
VGWFFVEGVFPRFVRKEPDAPRFPSIVAFVDFELSAFDYNSDKRIANTKVNFDNLPSEQCRPDFLKGQFPAADSRSNVLLGSDAILRWCIKHPNHFIIVET